jgi:site-specific DNA recombinase
MPGSDAGKARAAANLTPSGVSFSPPKRGQFLAAVPTDLLALFAKHDAALVSVSEHLDTQTASGRMVVSMLGVVAQWEREAIGERTAFALAHKRRTGKAYGPTPFGYRREGDAIEPIAAEQHALAEALRMDGDGASFREIGRMLTARGVSPKRGVAWHASSVRAVLRSKIATETAA